MVGELADDPTVSVLYVTHLEDEIDGLALENVLHLGVTLGVTGTAKEAAEDNQA